MAKFASGASNAAVENFSVIGGNHIQAIDSAVHFILGGLVAIKN